ncbi:heterokaryon incompatibility protein-domain-containing protein [Ustulina deusta]|nr:heterokaryon incompatibility protein-domain-containing protein [Ustulina deusta]
MATFTYSNMITIEYDKLRDSNRNIRLLRFRQPSSLQPIPFFMELHEYPLASVYKQFIAVSHHWTSSTKPLRESEEGFLVGGDLGRLLLQLKGIEPSLKKKFADFKGFWIDAICINQDDSIHDEEKVNQLQLLSQIYQSAESCLVVLGASDGSFLQSAIKYLKSGSAEHLKTQTTGRLSSLAFQAEKKGLERLFNLSYFRRVWILQEVILSPKIRVLYGLDLVEWEEFWTLSRKLSELSKDVEQLSTKHRNWVANMLRTPAYSVIRQRCKFRTNLEKPSIVVLIERFCIWESTEYVDRVLAHANICSEDILADKTNKEKLYQSIMTQVVRQDHSNEVIQEFQKLLSQLLKRSTPQNKTTQLSNDPVNVSLHVRPMPFALALRSSNSISSVEAPSVLSTVFGTPSFAGSTSINPIGHISLAQRDAISRSRQAGGRHPLVSTRRVSNNPETFHPIMEIQDTSPLEIHAPKRNGLATYIPRSISLLWDPSAFERRPVVWNNV